MKRAMLVFSIALFVVLLSSSVALAYHVANPDPHQRYGFEPATGFDSDFCLQCHDIHAAAGDYALMWQGTVTSTCGTCHGVYTAAPTGARDPGYPGQEAGPAATKAVFKVPLAQRYTHEGHRLSQGLSGAASYTYASGPSGDTETSPYTTASPNFIPGSGFPGSADPNPEYNYITRINNWTSFVAGASMANYLAGTDTVSGDGTGRMALGGLYCASCHSPHGTIRGQALAAGVTNGKLLSSRPNHAQTPMSTAGWTSWSANGYNFCLGCHDQRNEAATPNGLKPHNHPASFCLDCHGNNVPVSGTQDFPHTGAINLLSDYPDQLCVRSCHASQLP